jgi:AraC family transcriptional regulator
MEPKIVERGAFHVVGITQRFTPGKIDGIALLWDRFIQRAGEIADVVPGVHYGIGVDDRRDGDPGFLYTAGMGVATVGNVPTGMNVVTVPAGRYAVFTHRGPVTHFAKTIVAVWNQWLPQSGLKARPAPDFESYDRRFKLNSPDSEVDLYVPIEA